MSLETSNISKLLKIFEKNQNNIAITDTLRDNKITYKEFLNKSLDILQYLKEKKKNSSWRKNINFLRKFL